ncbi:MAG: MSMEG_1061 family FMN-dependent PPOX-type flavoprotein [Pseudomonadota bacterium]
MISDVESLRSVYGAPAERALAKQLDRLDAHCLRFLEFSPMMLLATCDGSRVDVSPKGDAPGFVRPDGSGSVLVPDWPGNNRLDGLENILRNPRVGMIFLIPGMRETLRINGRATIHDEETMRAPFETRGRLPLTVLRVEVEEVFLHCAKAFMRSRLWEPESWPVPEARPKAGEILRDHVADKAPAITDDEITARYEKVLY